MRKKRYAVVAPAVAVFIAAGMLLAIPQGASAGQGLSELQARKDAQYVLHRQFKGDWDYGNFKRVRCGARLSTNKRGCRVSWGIGDSSFRGTVTISDPGGQFFYYRYVIRQINQFCLATGGSNCVTVIAR
jgi:hypothetical protein